MTHFYLDEYLSFCVPCHGHQSQSQFQTFLDWFYIPTSILTCIMDGRLASRVFISTWNYLLLFNQKKRKITERDNWHFYQPKYLLQSQDVMFCTNHTIFDIFFCSSSICLIFDGDQFVFSISVWNLFGFVLAYFYHK